MEKWKLKEFNNCYCYNRNGKVYTYVFHNRATTPLNWLPENKELALEYLRNRIELHLGIKTLPKTMNSLKQDYFRNRLPNLAPTSQKKIKEVFKWLLDIPNYELTQTLEIRNAILKNMANHNISNNTQIKYLDFVKAFFNYGIDNDYLDKNPINKAIVPKKINKPVTAFSVEEIDAILDYLKTKHNIVYGVVLFTRFMGTRIAETLSIKWSDLKEGNVTFKRKGGYFETLPYSMFPELEFYLDNMPRTDLRVFPISAPKAGEHLAKAINELGIETKLSFHGIRKMRENELIKIYKNDIGLVAKFIGHTVAVQQKHYITELTVEEIKSSLNVSKI